MNKEIPVPVAGSEMGLILDVAGHEYKLNGNFTGNKFSLLYSSPPEIPIDLGSAKDALIAIGDVLFGKGEGIKLYKKIEVYISEMPALFKNIFTGFLNAHLVIIKMELILESGKPSQYAFCFKLLFIEKVSIAGVMLEYFTFEYDGVSKPKSIKGSTKSSRKGIMQ